MSKIFERDYAVAYARAYNDFVAEVCQEAAPQSDGAASVSGRGRGGRRRPIAPSPSWVWWLAVATQGMREHLGSQTFWPIYEELQRLNVPFCVPTGARDRRPRPLR